MGSSLNLSSKINAVCKSTIKSLNNKMLAKQLMAFLRQRFIYPQFTIKTMNRENVMFLTAE
jgi:hypothetical protein